MTQNILVKIVSRKLKEISYLICRSWGWCWSWIGRGSWGDWSICWSWGDWSICRSWGWDRCWLCVSNVVHMSQKIRMKKNGWEKLKDMSYLVGWIRGWCGRACIDRILNHSIEYTWRETSAPLASGTLAFVECNVCI